MSLFQIEVEIQRFLDAGVIDLTQLDTVTMAGELGNSLLLYSYILMLRLADVNLLLLIVTVSKTWITASIFTEAYCFALLWGFLCNQTEIKSFFVYFINCTLKLTGKVFFRSFLCQSFNEHI